MTESCYRGGRGEQKSSFNLDGLIGRAGNIPSGAWVGPVRAFCKNVSWNLSPCGLQPSAWTDLFMGYFQSTASPRRGVHCAVCVCALCVGQFPTVASPMFFDYGCKLENPVRTDRNACSFHRGNGNGSCDLLPVLTAAPQCGCMSFQKKLHSEYIKGNPCWMEVILVHVQNVDWKHVFLYKLLRECENPEHDDAPVVNLRHEMVFRVCCCKTGHARLPVQARNSLRSPSRSKVVALCAPRLAIETKAMSPCCREYQRCQILVAENRCICGGSEVSLHTTALLIIVQFF